ncbi:sensor histidine kinase [Paenibacillus sp. GCM10027629]|uniref:sensor histidine kinase n=1 Tax=Paenibacillus sp. GCM10027629 TaxID=3273414 RepID=UPI00362AE690
MKSINARIILYLSLLIGLSLISLGVISYQIFSRFTEKDMVKHVTSVTAQTNQSLDLYLSEIKDSLHFLSVNKDLISNLQNSISKNNYAIEQDQIRVRITELLYNIFAEKSDIRGYFIYNNDYKISFINNKALIGYDSPFLNKVWADFENTQYALQTRFYGSHKPDYYESTYNKTDDNVITIAANIKDPYDPTDSTLYGVAIFDYNISKIKRIYDQIQTQTGIESIIVDDQQQFIYQTDPSLTLSSSSMEKLLEHSSGYWTENIGGGKSLISYSTSDVTGWKTVSLLSFEQLDKNLMLIGNTTITLLAIMVTLTILFASAITIRTNKPILVLVKFIKDVGKGNLNLRLERKTKYEEFSLLNRGINDMLDKINELIEESVKRHLLQKEAEYDALQSKMDPHFLYNTLQSISSLSILGRNADIEKVTHALRDMLHYSLYRRNDMVPIQSEVRSVENYLNIQNIRYNGKIHFELDADDDVLYYSINKFTLQPLIENAIYHGLEGNDEDWLISIRITKQSEEVRIEISDNGIGMTPERLLDIRSQLSNKNLRTGRIGLSSIADRLELKFGPSATLEIDSEQYKGTIIVLTIPQHYTEGGGQYNDGTTN